MKFAITLPFPGTELFDLMVKNNRIKSFRWPEYNFAAPRNIYEHDNLSWEEVEHYYAKCHRDFYLRPAYIMKSIYRSIKNGQFLALLETFLKTNWF